MSGIAGYLGAPQPPSVLAAMLGKMRHRGPAVENVHTDAPVFMGVRLLDQGEAQPAYSEDHGISAIFAGQFYNIAEEAEALEKRGVPPRGIGAADVLLKMYEAYGIGCVNRMRGAFTFAIHDRQKDLVFIARDQLGVRPLYYATTQSGTFVFASEIKALFEHPAVRAEPDLRGIDAYLSLGYSPGPDAMFKGVHKLPPGHRILWNPGLHVMIEPYWQWQSFAKPDPVLSTDADFQARFDTLFEESVRLRCQAGGSLGIALSGDIESAAIAAVTAKEASSPVQAFCMDIEGEAGFAPASVAAQLGLKSEEVTFGAQDMDKLPELVWALDEPVADISIAQSYLLTRVARKQASSLFSGAGGAELFVSRAAQEVLLKARQKPTSYYKALKAGFSWAPQASLAASFGYNGKIGPRTKQRFSGFIGALRDGSLSRQYINLVAVMDARDKQELYRNDITHVMDTFADLQADPAGWPSTTATLLAMQEASALPDGVMAPFEKISMFNSIDCRLPFMDHRLAEFMLGLPDHLRGSAGSDKVLLRNYVERAHPRLRQVASNADAPRSLLAESLAGGPLKDMVETCLSEASVRRREMFDWPAVKGMLAGAREGEIVYHRQVFALTMLELWFRIFVDHEKGWISA